MRKTTMLKILSLVTLAAQLAACSVDTIAPQDPRDDPRPNGQKQIPILYDTAPVKRMDGNQILDSIAQITGHAFGTYDLTQPDPELLRASGKPNIDKTYHSACFLMQGCREHRVPAQDYPQTYGVPEVVLLDNLGRTACLDLQALGMFPGRADPDGNTQIGTTDAERIDAIIKHQYKAFLGAIPDAEELAASRAYFMAHMAGPETTGAGVSALESAGRGHCRAMISNAKFLYY